MQINYAFLADAAEFTPDGRLWMLGGDVDTIYTPQVPATHAELSLVIKLIIDPADSETEHQIHFQLLDPNNIPLVPESGFSFRPNPSQDPDLPNGYGICLGFQQLKFQQLGKHTVVVRIDGEERKRLPLKIVQKANAASVQEAKLLVEE